jgi:prolyl oligopeptidase
MLSCRFAPLVLLLIAIIVGKVHALNYPETKEGDAVDTYHGVQVPDPYRWLEDDNSGETKAWIEAQNKVTFGFLEQIPQRAKIRERLTKLWNYERFNTPIKEGDRYFFRRNSGLQNQSVLYVAESLEAEPRVLFDPNVLSPDGTVALAGYRISEDGKLIAYGLAKAGSDWQEWRVREVDSGKDRDDVLEWVKFSRASWAKDGSGFYYSRYAQPTEGQALTGLNEFQKLYFHKLGTRQSDDVLVYERRDHRDWGFHGEVTEDGRYLVITITKGTDPKVRVYYRDLADTGRKVIPLLDDFDAEYDFIANDGPVFFFKTDLEAPRSRVIAIDVTKPGRANWREIISQSEDALKAVDLVNEQFICNYLHDAHSRVRILAWDGKSPRTKLVRDVELPGIGSAGGFEGKRADTETFYSFTSFTVPATIHRLDLTTGKSSVFREPKVDFDPAGYETKQVFIRSKDGTRVPMFITHRRGLKLDGANPTLLYGYGGFNNSITPVFEIERLAWMEIGGVYAVANLRGGGEYGAAWHLAGTKRNKQNVFDDFIAAAEWLTNNGYTSPAKLAIEGRSNGGLLVGAAMTQRPELFGAALPAVGVMDMLRFHKFTIGWAWKSDYGSSDNADDFPALFAYSPLHRLQPGTRYPATLITTADHDDRVVPAHSFKFAARLQECQFHGGPPVLIRIETKAGHGTGKPTAKEIDEEADQMAFLVRVLGIDAK